MPSETRLILMGLVVIFVVDQDSRVSLVSLRKLLYASGGPAVQRI